MRIKKHSDIKCDIDGCFAYDTERHECTILNNTNFGDKACPFKRLKQSKGSDVAYGSIECKEEDCFACDTKRYECRILTNTDFGDNSCPFKKNKYEFFRKMEESR